MPQKDETRGASRHPRQPALKSQLHGLHHSPSLRSHRARIALIALRNASQGFAALHQFGSLCP